MFRGNNSNTAAPSFLENHLQYPADVSNQLQLCGNLPIEFHADPVNYLGSNNGTPFLLTNKCGRDAEARQQKLLFSLNNRTLNDEPDGKTSLLNLNPVSTGLRLSYDDDERNSSISSASGSLTAASSIFPSLGSEIKRELDQQKEEFDSFIRTQEENMMKGVRDIRQRHMACFLTALEKGVFRKLQEKDVELESITRKNKELVESMKQVTSEAQNWCYMAKYNESVVNVLKNNLQQAMQGSNAGKEGHGESDADDAASCIDPNNYLSVVGRSSSVKRDMLCKACKAKELCILLDETSAFPSSQRHSNIYYFSGRSRVAKMPRQSIRIYVEIVQPREDPSDPIFKNWEIQNPTSDMNLELFQAVQLRLQPLPHLLWYDQVNIVLTPDPQLPAPFKLGTHIFQLRVPTARDLPSIHVDHRVKIRR